jgi:hypothetical protein
MRDEQIQSRLGKSIDITTPAIGSACGRDVVLLTFVRCLLPAVFLIG